MARSTQLSLSLLLYWHSTVIGEWQWRFLECRDGAQISFSPIRLTGSAVEHVACVSGGQDGGEGYLEVCTEYHSRWLQCVNDEEHHRSLIRILRSWGGEIRFCFCFADRVPCPLGNDDLQAGTGRNVTGGPVGALDVINVWLGHYAQGTRCRLGSLDVCENIWLGARFQSTSDYENDC